MMNVWNIPARTFVIKEIYTQYVYHEEQDHYAEPGTCMSSFLSTVNAGEILTMETRDDGAFW